MKCAEGQEQEPLTRSRLKELLVFMALADIIPENEAERMAAVRRFNVLDTPPDGAFDRVTALAARRFGVPISIISIVDENRIWFKSPPALLFEQTDRAPGLCASAILANEPYLLPDASIDPRSLANPLVAGDFGPRFYVGVPRLHKSRAASCEVVDRPLVNPV